MIRSLYYELLWWQTIHELFKPKRVRDHILCMRSLYNHNIRDCFDPLGQPTVTAGSDPCFHACFPSVRPHFSRTSKTISYANWKQYSLLVRLRVWPSESLMAHMHSGSTGGYFDIFFKIIFFSPFTNVEICLVGTNHHPCWKDLVSKSMH